MTKEEMADQCMVNIHVTSIKRAKEFHLGYMDAMILKWFYNWYITGKMLKEEEKGVSYYWINYTNASKDLEYLGFTTKQGVAQRLSKLCGEGDNPIPKPFLTKIVRNYRAYAPQAFFHLDESFFFSIVARGPHIGTGLEAPTIEEEFNSAPQDKAVEVPAEEPSSHYITPDTTAFIDKVLSLNPQFSKPRINLTDPSKALMNIQTYRHELLDGSFIERHQNQLPLNLRSVVLPTLTEADLLSRMAGVKLTNKIGIGDYFLSYNHNTKSYSSMFVSYMSKSTKDKAPTPSPKAVVVEVKTSGMHPKAIAYMSDKQKEAHAKLGVTDMAALARVADGVYSWYEDYEKATLSWNEYKSPKNLLWALKNFTEPWKEKTGKSVDELYKTLSVFDTSNHTWLLFARFMYQRSNILLHSKLSCAIIQSGDNWAWVDYNSLRKDIG